MRCAECGATRRDVTLWRQIVAVLSSITVCCLTEELPW